MKNYPINKEQSSFVLDISSTRTKKLKIMDSDSELSNFGVEHILPFERKSGKSFIIIHSGMMRKLREVVQD